MDLEYILVCMLSSTLAVAVVNSIKELIIWKLNRKAKLADDDKEDQHSELKSLLAEHQKSLEKIVKTIDDLEKKVSLTLENDKTILKDKIKYLVVKYVELQEITLDEKQAIHHMWNIYHYDLNGNGDLDDYMDMLEEVPVVNHHSIRVQ